MSRLEKEIRKVSEWWKEEIWKAVKKVFIGVEEDGERDLEVCKRRKGMVKWIVRETKKRASEEWW